MPERSKSSRIVVFGEVLFDCFPDGNRVLGGAPFNVAWALQGLGQTPLFVSAVGQDTSGRRVRDKAESWGLSLDGLQYDAAHPTGEVAVSISGGEPSYEICKDRAWDHIEDVGLAAKDLLYHGSLALRSEENRASFEALVARSSGQRFFDVNLRPPFDSLKLVRQWMQSVDWLKLNLEELRVLVGDSALDFETCEGALAKLRREYGIKNIVLTAGSAGARIAGDYGDAICMPAPRVANFVDAVGAGDAFAAYVIYGALQGMPAKVLVEHACAFAAKTCEHLGATVESPNFYKSAQ